MRVLPGGTQAQLDCPKEVNAAELELLIRQLSELRADMTPAVPFDRPRKGSDEIALVDEPSLLTAKLHGGRVRFWLRHVGQGWLAFNLSTQATTGLQAYLNAKFDSDPAAAEFFANQRPDADGTH